VSGDVCEGGFLGVAVHGDVGVDEETEVAWLEVMGGLLCRE
jgi:hypothetical protein